jgi:hypothetical protein
MTVCRCNRPRPTSFIAQKKISVFERADFNLTLRLRRAFFDARFVDHVYAASRDKSFRGIGNSRTSASSTKPPPFPQLSRRLASWRLIPCSLTSGFRRSDSRCPSPAAAFLKYSGDVFDNKAPSTWRRDLFTLIRECDGLDWLLLTKRNESNARRHFLQKLSPQVEVPLIFRCCSEPRRQETHRRHEGGGRARA